MTAREHRDQVRWNTYNKTYDVDMLKLMAAPLSATGASR
jgi:hypothetical protein